MTDEQNPGIEDMRAKGWRIYQMGSAVSVLDGLVLTLIWTPDKDQWFLAGPTSLVPVLASNVDTHVLVRAVQILEADESRTLVR